MSRDGRAPEEDREAIAETLGLWIEDTRLDELRRVLDQRRRTLGDITPGAYRELLTSPGEAGEEEGAEKREPHYRTLALFVRNDASS